jgi:predicted SAM-dependent methyltransferase
VDDLRKKQGIRLDIGCGRNKQVGFIGVDKRDVEGVDVVHDIEVFPWPIPDGCCSVIMMSHVVEHIKPWLQLDMMNELWRVMEVDGLLMIATPYATSFGYYQDPTHCSPWNEATPFYFVKGHNLYEIYTPKPWKLDREVSWQYQANMEVCFRKLAE